MKTLIQFIFLFIFSIGVYAQTPEQIKKSSNYIWGESRAETTEQADQFAIKELVSQISTKVESSFSMIMTESSGTLEEYTESAINTYSNIYLNDAKRIITKKKKSVSVFRYIDRKELEIIFENRRLKIFDYTNLAVKAEKELRTGDALRYYYWALALLSSHPDCNRIKYSCEETEYSLITFIQSEIDKILHTIRIEISQTIEKPNGKSYLLDITYKGKPVANLDYIYWHGDSWSNLYSIKDGLGVIELYGGQADDISDLRIKLEYLYKSRSHIDQEVSSVLEMAQLPRLKNAELFVPISGFLKIEENINTQPIISSIGIKQKEELSEETVKKKYVKAITSINQSIISNGKTLDAQLFTDEGFYCYNRILSYGNAELLPSGATQEYIKIQDKTMVRSFPMLFKFPNNKSIFVEDIVYTFDSTGKICNINFALSKTAINDILNKGERFGSNEEKYFLINFLENYKTAYCLENLDYLSSVFSDDALIVVGTVLKPSKQIDGMYNLLEDQNVKYTRYSKEEYITHLQKAFDSKEFVNVQFEENQIKKTGGDEKIYGIQLAQNYWSSNYSDKGYLFLMLDLNDTLNPTIYVRTWQPEKNTDGSIIGLENFSIK